MKRWSLNAPTEHSTSGLEMVDAEASSDYPKQMSLFQECEACQ